MGFRNAVGYMIGFILFVVTIPLLMRLATGDTDPSPGGTACLAVMTAGGLGLSIWSIVYMKIRGDGNPVDAFGHAIAQRTSRLMTTGPYRICRNPMLLGACIYYAGVLIFLHSWQAAAIFAAFFAVSMIQVRTEEERLERDFGDEYRRYKEKTKKMIPFIW